MRDDGLVSNPQDGPFGASTRPRQPDDRHPPASLRRPPADRAARAEREHHRDGVLDASVRMGGVSSRDRDDAVLRLVQRALRPLHRSGTGSARLRRLGAGRAAARAGPRSTSAAAPAGTACCWPPGRPGARRGRVRPDARGGHASGARGRASTTSGVACSRWPRRGAVRRGAVRAHAAPRRRPGGVLPHVRSLAAPGGTVLVADIVDPGGWATRDFHLDRAFADALVVHRLTGDPDAAADVLRLLLHPRWLQLTVADTRWTGRPSTGATPRHSRGRRSPTTSIRSCAAWSGPPPADRRVRTGWAPPHPAGWSTSRPERIPGSRGSPRRRRAAARASRRPAARPAGRPAPRPGRAGRGRSARPGRPRPPAEAAGRPAAAASSSGPDPARPRSRRTRRRPPPRGVPGVSGLRPCVHRYT